MIINKQPKERDTKNELRKFIRGSLLVIIFIILCSFVTAGFCDDWTGYMYCDDFEDNDASHWEGHSGLTVEINSTHPINETYSVQAKGGPGQGRSANWTYGSKIGNQGFNISVDTNFSVIVNAGYNAFVFGQKFVSDTGFAFRMEQVADKCSSQFLCRWTDVGYADTGTKYYAVKHIMLKVYDLGGVAVADLYLNHQLDAVAIPTRGGDDLVSDITNMTLYFNKPGHFLFDNLIVWNETLIPVGGVQPNSSSIELFYLNETLSIPNNKSIFDEGENFHAYVNWTDDLNNIPLNDSVGECNITFIDGLFENKSINDNFTICGSGCDYSTYSEVFNLEETTNAVMDTAHAFVCNEDLQQQDAIVNISCNNGAIKYSELRTGLDIALCSEGLSFVTVNTSVCTGFEDLNVTLTYDGIFQRRKRVLDLTVNREFSEHTLTAQEGEVVFDTTLKLWKTDHTHEYYEHGLKYIYANCSSSIDENFNNSILRPVVIVNVPPQIFIESVNNTYGFTTLSNNVVIEYSQDIWNWFIAVSDDDLDTINYTFFNSSKHIIFSYLSTEPVLLNTSEGLFAGFVDGNPYNFSILANDTNGDETFSSILFKINDTINPSYEGLDNVDSLPFGVNYTWNANILDDHLWIFNISCNDTNNFKFSVFGIANSSYHFQESINISSDIRCDFNITDGHTRDVIGTKDIRYADNKLVFEGIDIGIEEQLKSLTWEKKRDRYSFCVEPVYQENYIMFNISEDCISYPSDEYKGWYVCENKYYIDFENDLNMKVTKMGNRVKVDTSRNKGEKVCFNSIGELNKVSGSQELIYDRPNPLYDTTAVEDTNWFNDEALDTETLPGVFMYIFLFSILCALIALSEKVRIPMMAIFSAIYGFFLSWLLFTEVSAIVGVILVTFSFLYMIRGFAMTNE